MKVHWTDTAEGHLDAIYGQKAWGQVLNLDIGIKREIK